MTAITLFSATPYHHHHISPLTTRPPQEVTHGRTHLFILLALLWSLNLLRTPKLLLPILPLLSLLSAGLLNLCSMAHSDKSVSWLEFLHRLDTVVNKCEAGGLAATVLGAHAENVDLLRVGLVDFGELGAEVILGDICAVGV